MNSLGGQTVTFIERVEIGHGDYDDAGRTVSPGWSVQPMTAVEQEQAGLQVTRRWRVFGPPVTVPGTFQLEVAGLVDTDGTVLRLDVHGALEVWPDETGAPHHCEGVVEVVEGVSR